MATDTFSSSDDCKAQKVSEDLSPSPKTDDNANLHLIMQKLKDLDNRVQMHDNLLNIQNTHRGTATEINKPHIVKVAAYPDVAIGIPSLFPNPLSHDNSSFNSQFQTPFQIPSDDAIGQIFLI